MFSETMGRELGMELGRVIENFCYCSSIRNDVFSLEFVGSVLTVALVMSSCSGWPL